MSTPAPHSILLIIGGGIAAYKSLELIRLLKGQNIAVHCVLTKAAEQFVTPLSVASLSGNKIHSDLFSLTDEMGMGHIELSRSADLVVVAPATADLMAKMAQGLANDLASTLLLATDKPVLLAPAMNVRMWHHPATQRNLAQLKQDAVLLVGPNAGPMACGETGLGRMSEPAEILAAIQAALTPTPPVLAGRKVLVTAGPTREPIDPVRYISNHSSGKQGYAIAKAAAALGAETVLVSGPVALPAPAGVRLVQVETASQMLAACEAELPCDIALCVAAVADWRVATAGTQKLKKQAGHMPSLTLLENPDILHALAQRETQRPRLVIGFAAETENLMAHAKAKLEKKGCDMIVANDVSEHSGTFGGDTNKVHLVTESKTESWPILSKHQVADCLMRHLAQQLGPK